jgi:hypothetical protein
MLLAAPRLKPHALCLGVFVASGVGRQLRVGNGLSASSVVKVVAFGFKIGRSERV